MVSLTVANDNCVTVPRNPMSPLPTASSLNVAGTFTSLLPVLSSVPPTPTHRSTPSSVTLIACASVSVVIPSPPLTWPSVRSKPDFATTTPSNKFSATLPSA